MQSRCSTLLLICQLCLDEKKKKKTRAWRNALKENHKKQQKTEPRISVEIIRPYRGYIQAQHRKDRIKEIRMASINKSALYYPFLLRQQEKRPNYKSRVIAMSVFVFITAPWKSITYLPTTALRGGCSIERGRDSEGRVREQGDESQRKVYSEICGSKSNC